MTDRIYIADVSVLEDKTLYDALYALMPRYRQEKTDRYRHISDRHLSLGAGALLHYALSAEGFDDADICTDRYGRPYLEGIYFSLSHTGTMALCAVSEKNVGADAEQVRAFADTLAERVFSAEERAFAGGDDRLCTRLWTAKESVMKYTGRGLSLGTENILLDITGGRPVMAHAAGEDMCLRSITHGIYEITVCSASPFADELTVTDLHSLI